MKARQRQPFVLTATERQALDAARAKFVQWKRDWHDDGAAVNHSELAALRKHARAFHKALQPLLHNGAGGTMARLLAQMQMTFLHREPQGHYRDQLLQAYGTAIEVDVALAVGKGGQRKDRLVYTWIWHAADEWPDAPTAAGRFGEALLDHRHADTPAVGSVERIADALTMWGQRRNG
jgi:hypothetical protein